IIPVAVLPLPWWQVVAGALIMSFVSSVAFVTLLIGTHFAEETVFPEVDENGYVPYDWAIHALVTSLDWNPTSPWGSFIAGGANAHAAHHLFPSISHCHYVEITKLIQRTAAEFGVPYNQTTLPGIVASHFRFLKRMGRTIAGTAPPTPERSDPVFESYIQIV
ncbi:MAG: fatty acid desaturase, partial [Dongiaceae bacterium]